MPKPLLSADHICQISIPEDLPYLHSHLLPVNMRLFRSSEGYRHVVLTICEHIREMALTKMSDYSRPFGMSAANVGIPFNIIGVVHFRNSEMFRYCEIMINPVITKRSHSNVVSSSNCGSIRLSQPVQIIRSEIVWVDYFDTEGRKQAEKFDNEHGGLTVQHEIDHNNGVLITDYPRTL